GRVGSRPALFKATSRIIECNEFCRPRVAVSKLATEATVLGAVQLALNVAEQKILPDIENYDAFPRERQALHHSGDYAAAQEKSETETGRAPAFPDDRDE
ncbi:MAG TPA: hypothetical protein VGW37_12895, partial [Terriglobia bacterium]|nr:hypothetical protein [Terriglobia bacterium]